MGQPKIRKGKDIDVKVRLIVNDEPADMSKVTELKVSLKKDMGTLMPVLTNIDFTRNPLSFSLRETCQYPAGKYRLMASWNYNGVQTAYDFILFELVNHTEEENLKGCDCSYANIVTLDANMSVTMGGEGRGIAKAEIIDKELILTYTDDEVVNLGKVVGNLYEVVREHGLSETITEDEFYQLLANIQNKVDKQEGYSLVKDREIAKLETIEESAQENIIEKISLNGAELLVQNKKVDIDFSGYITDSAFEQFKETVDTEFQNIDTHQQQQDNILEALNQKDVQQDIEIEATKTKIQSNTESISDIHANISDIEVDIQNIIDKNTQQDAEISQNTSDIAVNKTDIETNKTNIASNAENISNINFNISEIEADIQDIVDKNTQQDTEIQKNTTDISVNKTDIETNKTNIASNTENISNINFNISEIEADIQDIVDKNIQQDTEISQNTSSISVNKIEIEANRINIASNAKTISGINANLLDIETDIQDIFDKNEQQDTQISQNIADISGIKNNIEDIENKNVQQDVIIAQNTEGISSNTQSIRKQEGDISKINEELTDKANVYRITEKGINADCEYNYKKIEGVNISLTNKLDAKENVSNKVSISSASTENQYPNAKSVWDLVQDVAATIPAGGLKVPVSLESESQLPNVSTLEVGDYFFMQNMDITSPERTGKAWVNYTNPSNDATPLRYYKVIDQYQSMDGASITQTQSGAWEVNSEWLKKQVDGKLDKETGKQLSTEDYTTTEKAKLASLSNTVVENVLNSTSTANALSANMGKYLKDNKLDEIRSETSTNQLYMKRMAGTQGMLNIQTGNGLHINNDALQMDVASGSQPGAVTIGTQTFKGQKSFNDRVRLTKGQYLVNAYGQNNKTGYVKIATIQITGTHINSPIEFSVAQRGGSSIAKLRITFKNKGDTDPDFATFCYDTAPISAYLHKSATSLWDLYIQKSEAYDEVSLISVDMSQYTYSRCSLSYYSNILVDTPPAGATKAILSALSANISGNAATATKLLNARNFKTNLASNETISFDGSGDGDVTMGVEGTLPIANGGTGGITLQGAADSLKFQSLSSGIKIPSNSDMNNFKTPGSYTIDSAAIANTINNLPWKDVGGAFIVETSYKNTNGHIFQTAWEGNQGYKKYYRRYFNSSSSTWSGWITWESGENKVDIIKGKQLSTEDYTTTEKNKLAGLSNTTVVNVLTSTSTAHALSANMGKQLQDNKVDKSQMDAADTAVYNKSVRTGFVYPNVSLESYWFRLGAGNISGVGNHRFVKLLVSCPFTYSFTEVVIDIRNNGTGSKVVNGVVYNGNIDPSRFRVYWNDATFELWFNHNQQYNGAVTKILQDTYLSGYEFQNFALDVATPTEPQTPSSSLTNYYECIGNKQYGITPTANNHLATKSYVDTADTSGNAETATTAAKANALTTARNIWGQPFNGEENVIGNMTGVGSITANGTIIVTKSGNYYDQGIRINRATNASWATLTLGSVGASGTDATTWLLGRSSEGNLVVDRNSSNGTQGFAINTSGNVGIGYTATAIPAYRLAVNGTGAFVSDLSASRLLVKNTNAVKHLEFTRQNANYITAPSNGYFIFQPNNGALGLDGSPLIIGADKTIRPGTTNAISNGTSSFRWSNIYSTLGNFSGTVTAPTFVGDLSGNAETATKLQDAKNISLSGDITGSASFDGNSDIVIETSLLKGTQVYDCIGTTAKTLTIDGITSLSELTGKIIFLKMNYSITSNYSITLNVNGLGVVGCRFFYNNSSSLQSLFPAYSLVAGNIYPFVYNGSNFVLANTIQYIDNSGSSSTNIAASAARVTALNTKLISNYTRSLQSFAGINSDIDLYDFFARRFSNLWESTCCLNIVFHNENSSSIYLAFPINGAGGKTNLIPMPNVLLGADESIEISVMVNMESGLLTWQCSDKLYVKD